MIDYILALAFLLLSLVAITLRKTYDYLPEKELRRRAKAFDPLAKTLYRAVAYRGSLDILLWVFIIAFPSIGFVLLARVAPIWLAFVAVALLLWLSFLWLPATRLTGFGARLTAAASPSIAWLLNYLHPILARIAVLVARRKAEIHTGLFEREDFIDLLGQQRVQSDSRMSPEELDIISRVLGFGGHTVSTVLMPLREVKTVNENDTIGPILIDELHRLDQAIVPVTKEGKANKVVGTLTAHELGIQSKGQVKDVMDPVLYYLHEKDSLTEALHAFYVTNSPIFIALDDREKVLGIVTIESILRELLGHIPGESFEQYTDSATIALRYANPEPEAADDDVEAVAPTEDPTQNRE